MVRGWGASEKVDVMPLGSVHVFRKPPEVVWVEFGAPGASWQLDGVPAPNVYPVTRSRAAWFLDG